MTEAIYRDGLSQNLEAAAMDAVPWLELFYRRSTGVPSPVVMDDVNLQRLSACIKALAQFLCSIDVESEDVPARESGEIATELAEYAHEAWSGWMNYLLSKSKVNDDGTWTIPAQYAERWYRQMTTPYHLLPESEKTIDRAEAHKLLEIVSQTSNQFPPPVVSQPLVDIHRHA